MGRIAEKTGAAGLALTRAIRRNHAVEHGTVETLLARRSPTPLAGLATPWGFVMVGPVPAEAVEEAATEALERLRGGEADLAVSHYCGTNLVVGAVIAGVVAAVVTRRSTGRLRHVRAAAAGMLVAALLRGPVGREVQRRVTTLADVGRLKVRSVRSARLGGYYVSFVRTSE